MNDLKNNTSSLLKQITWLVIFSIAMAFMESAVVVYLREIYYPEGFLFPLAPIDANIALTEVLREIATIIMLAGIGILTGNSSSQRFAFFLMSFAIWDIFYYIFLYALLGWPSSLFTWDILFLVPIPWVGPVITPVIVSLLMILLASSLIHFKKNLNPVQWLLSIVGSVIVILSWVLDYWTFSSNNYVNGAWTIPSEQELFGGTKHYIPTSFNWYIFLVGVLFISAAIASHYVKNRKIQK